MLSETLRQWLSQRSLEPQTAQRALNGLEIVVGALLAGGLWWVWPRSRESGFAVREADRRKARLAEGAAQLGKTTQPDPLAQARIARPEILALTGIRIDGPPHEVLGISPGASPEEIQRAYRERMKQYHPDKVAPPGSPQWQEAQKIAEAINRAKNELMKRASTKRSP